MVAKLVDFGKKVREQFREGINLLEKTVAGTLGPGGRTVIINHPHQGTPIVTKDGVTVAKYVTLPGANQNIATRLLIDAAVNVNDSMGDGTTTTVILTSSIFREGLKLQASGYTSTQNMVLEFNKLRDLIFEVIDENTQMVETEEDIKAVAYLASNSDNEIADNILKAVSEVGKDGLITVSRYDGTHTHLEMREGYCYQQPPLHTDFLNGEIQVEYENPIIVITTDPLTAQEDIIPLMEKVYNEQRPLVIFAPEFGGLAKTVLAANAAKGTIKVIPIQLPGIKDRQKEMAEDLSQYTGTRIRSRIYNTSLESAEIEELGSCEIFRADKKEFNIIGGSYSEGALLDYIDRLKDTMAAEGSAWQREKIQERIGRLTGGFIDIQVGGVTETEMEERKDRYDDAINAVRSAIEGGTAPGGGITWLKAADRLRQKNTPEAGILADALEKIMWWIIFNVGGKPDQIIERARGNNLSELYNAETGRMEKIAMTKIRDSVLNLKEALSVSISTAMMLLSVECSIYTANPEHDLLDDED